MNPLMVNDLAVPDSAGVVARHTGERNLLGRTIHHGIFSPFQYAIKFASTEENSLNIQ